MQPAVAEPIGAPLLVDYPEAARLLGLSKTTVVRLVAAGRLPAVRVGHSVRIRRAAIEQFALGDPQNDHDPAGNRAAGKASDAGAHNTV